MELDAEACYRALLTRDARFDGRFFTGVKTTGVYCRPICPARTPFRKNCFFFSCAAAAQEAGFRPCLRCRPEIAPNSPAWNGTSATVSKALRLIAEGALDDGPVDRLTGRVGVGERQLRRLFNEHVGASPLTVASAQRILFAKKLLLETALPITDIAFAAGYSSVRRFNHAMLDAYQRSPRELRGRRPPSNTAIMLTLPFRPPYNWNALVRFLRPRAIPGVEQVTEDSYARTIRIDGVPGRVEVTPISGATHLLARIELQNLRPLARVACRLRRMFDTGAPIEEIESQLRPLIKAAPGVRVPGSWDVFELTVRAILGQQVTVKGATTLSGRLVQQIRRDIRTWQPLPRARNDGPRRSRVHWITARPRALAASGGRSLRVEHSARPPG